MDMESKAPGRPLRPVAAARQLRQDDTMPTPDQAKPMLHVSITIEATFGSEIQRDVSVKVLKQFLEVWTQNVESSHKKNKVGISVKQQAPDIIQ